MKDRRKGFFAGYESLIPMLTLVALIPASCSKQEENRIPAPSAMISTDLVVRRDFTRTVTGYGYVRPLKEADIVAYTQGRLTHIWVGNGEEVEKGQRLLAIEGYYRVKEEEELGPNERPGPENEIIPIVKTAPMAGSFSLTKTLWSTVRAGEILAQVIDLDDLLAEIEFFSADVESIRIGQLATISASAGQGTGTVTFVSQRIDPRSGGRKVGIEVTQGEPRKVLPGDFVRADLVVARRSSSLAVPKGAVLNDHGSYVVFVKEGQGYRKRSIGTGWRDEGFVEAREGVRENEEVVTVGAYELLHRGIEEKIKPED